MTPLGQERDPSLYQSDAYLHHYGDAWKRRDGEYRVAQPMVDVTGGQASLAYDSVRRERRENSVHPVSAS